MKKNKKTEKKTKPDELLRKYYKFATTSNDEVIDRLLCFLKNEYGKKIVYFGSFNHYKDIYNKQDEELNPEHKTGTKKPNHKHISICFNTPIRLGTIHNKIKQIITEEDDKNVNSEGFIVVHNQSNRGDKTSYFAMCNMIDYWFHRGEANQHKTQYTKEDRAGSVLYGISWEEYDKYFNTYITKDKVDEDNFDKDDWNKLTKIQHLIRAGQLTLSKLEEDDEAFYLKNKRKLEEARDDFIRKIPKPEFQQTFYIYGNVGGIGKSMFCKLWASKLGTVFNLGKKQVRFQLYTGENSIIWNDVRHITIKQYDVNDWLDDFDPAKPASAQNKKNGVVLLKNKYWFMNGIQDIDEVITFYDTTETTNEYGYKEKEYVERCEDTAQFRRRIKPVQLYYDDDKEQLTIRLFKTTGHFSKYEELFSKTFNIKIEDKIKQPKLKALYEEITAILVECWDDDNLEWLEQSLEKYDEIKQELNKIEWVS